MCGFVGYLLPEGARQPDLGGWSDLIRHRGPDQAGQAISQSFGIGTRRLSILDLSPAGAQPMESARYVLGFNGEIYNHQQLRRELAAEGAPAFASHSDTETVLSGLEQWGIDETLRRLNGMYALAIWDKLSGELTLARDPLGVKPVYYVAADREVYYASELKALRPFVQGRLSREGTALFLYFGFVPAPHSLLAGVQKVRPGEVLTFGPTGLSRRRVLPRAWTAARLPSPDPRERVGQLRAEVSSAVHRQLVADVPVGLFLSGGVDSSILAAVAAERQPGLASFSLRPVAVDADPGAQRDAELAARSARRLGLTHHEVPLRPEDVAEGLDRFLRDVDEPVAELYAAAEVVLSKTAREAGVPVVLTGHGADEVFIGYPTYQAVLRGDLYNAVPGLGLACALAAAAPGLGPRARSNLHGVASVWRKPVLERYAIVSGVHFALEDAAVLAGLPVEQVRSLVDDVLSAVQAVARELPRGAELHNVELFARMDLLLMVPEHYNTRLDRTTMSSSIEARVPFQDLELTGFVMQLSHRDLLRGGPKGMLRRAFADVLPEEVARRPKQTFQAPMVSWLAGPLARWVRDQIGEESSLPCPSPAADGQAPATPREAYRAWSLALLAAWRKALALESWE